MELKELAQQMADRALADSRRLEGRGGPVSGLFVKYLRFQQEDVAHAAAELIRVIEAGYDEEGQ